MYYFTTAINLERHFKIPEIPLDRSCCDGSDNEDREVKQEPMDSDQVKSEESPTAVKPEDLHSDSQSVHVLADSTKQEAGKL